MDAVYCRREAERCVKLSETATTPNLKTILLSMARSWIHLANQMDRLHELKPESRPTEDPSAD